MLATPSLPEQPEATAAALVLFARHPALGSDERASLREQDMMTRPHIGRRTALAASAWRCRLGLSSRQPSPEIRDGLARIDIAPLVPEPGLQGPAAA